jgi:hypothetical protein
MAKGRRIMPLTACPTAEAFAEYGVAAFRSRLAEPHRKFLLAEQGAGLISFAEMLTSARKARARICSALNLSAFMLNHVHSGAAVSQPCYGQGAATRRSA